MGWMTKFHIDYGKSYFLELQVYGINDNMLYQDNKSAMLLEKNRKKSRTKKINIFTCNTIS